MADQPTSVRLCFMLGFLLICILSGIFSLVLIKLQLKSDMWLKVHPQHQIIFFSATQFEPGF